MRSLFLIALLLAGACLALGTTVSSENEHALEEFADEALESEYYFIARAPSRAQRLVYAVPQVSAATIAANRLTGTQIYSASARSQISSLRAAGVTVRVLAVDSSPGPAVNPNRVNLFCDTYGIIVRITVG
jgi:hypothetical protein